MTPLPDSPTSLNSSRSPRFVAQPAPIVFLLCLMVGLAAVAWRANEGADAARVHARNAAQARGSAVELQFGQALTAAEVLGALAKESGFGISNFQKVALELLASRPGLASLELQPGGVISDIVPRVGNERAIGSNVLKDEAQRPGAYAAIQRRALTVTGPLTLYHGEPGIVVRVPIFQRRHDGRDNFWGFVAVSMRLPEALARAGVDELSTQGYNYVFYAPSPAQQKAATIAAHGSLSLQDAVQQPVWAQNLEFRLALRPRSGWVNATKVAFESLGVLMVSSLLCLLVSLREKQRLTAAGAARRQAQKDCGGTEEGRAAVQPEVTLAELHNRLEETARRANEVNEIAQTKLKQAELSVRDLQTRLDTTVRAAAEEAQARQTELDQMNLALAQAHQAIGELQSRLDVAASAENRTAAATQARLQLDQSIIADLQSRLDAINQSAREAAEASVPKLKQTEAGNQELRGRLLVAEKAENRVTELSDLLQKTQAELKQIQNDSATKVGVSIASPVDRAPSEPKEIKSGEPVMSLVEPAAASSSSIVVLAAPLGQSSAIRVEKNLNAVPSEGRGEHLPVPPAATNSKAKSTAPPMSNAALAEATAITVVPAAKRKSARIAKRKKIRRDEQIDLFEGRGEAAVPPPDPVADVAEFKLALKPNEGKPASVHKLPTSPPVNPAQLRKAMNEILPLLADQDPGAKDCLKANFATFRSAFSADGYEEFDQFVNRGDFATALEHLKKAAKKHGIS